MQSFESRLGCGLITQKCLNTTIFLCGWVDGRRDHGGLIFIDLRDRTGIMQLVLSPEIAGDIHKQAHGLRSEFVIAVSGKVIERSKETINKELPTGKWELQVEKLEILNKAKALPFMLEDGDIVDEEIRLKYRYLDLRRPKMRKNFELRHKVTFAMREFLHEQGFYEIETPILTKNTPEGAREFLVPSRVHPGSVYALPQSPQLYKQILMASGMEKYFQIARCFRDEDLRADRQPEFTQLDIEMSFINENDIQNLTEKLFQYIYKKVLNEDIKIPFTRMTYDKAISNYGSDKPDTRFDLKIYDATVLFKETELSFLRSVIDKGGKIGGLHLRGREFSRSELDGMVDRAQRHGAKGLVWIRVKEENKLESPIARFLPENFFTQAQEIFPTIAHGSVLLLVAGNYKNAWDILGRLRLELGKELNLIDQKKNNFLWVTDFPLFEYDQDAKRFNAVHHPFTSPQEGWESLKPEQMQARAYDVILNGVELGGGSIRIYQREMQEKVFDILGLDKKETQEKFGFLLEALDLGFPPLGGIAFGLDRLIMLMVNATSIREVIAFPKTARGYDPMMESPSKVNQEQLKDYGLKLLPGVAE